ncbi:hypothetical protein ACFL2K_00815 [Candidatus Margulisiibacteriota bacterium]
MLAEHLEPLNKRYEDVGDKGDCFFESIVKGLKEKNIINPKTGKFYTIKDLRIICMEYAKAALDEPNENNKWLKDDLEKDISSQYQSLKEYANYIGLAVEDVESANEISKRNDTVIWGRPHIEGKILFKILGLNIRVIETLPLRENPKDKNDFVINSKEYFYCEDPKHIIEIANYPGHFMAVLKLRR